MSTLRLEMEAVRRALDNLDADGECVCGGSVTAPCSNCTSQEGLGALKEVDRYIQEADRIMRVLERTAPLVPIQELGAIKEWLADR